MSQDKIFGWITPTRRFIPTDAWQHFQEIGKDPELKALVPEYDNRLADLEEIEASCREMQERYGPCQGEWHDYEITNDDYRRDAVKALYAAGVIRVGTVGSMLHFEGTPDGIQNLYQFCRDFAEGAGMETQFEPIRGWGGEGRVTMKYQKRE
ncbi:MAG: hypothetical protein KGL39_28875 [Patescibacteria group bacterium]|nr:hypothetical protein [Patescibacteria group bacterium]